MLGRMIVWPKTAGFAATLVGALLLAGTAGAEDTVKNPASGSPEAAVAAAFEAALSGSFSKYLETVHPDHKDNDRQRKQREKYEWKRFLKQHKWYLVADQPVTFVVASRREEGQNHMRLFIRDQKNKDRMPVPVRLKRDGKSWKIVVSSL